MVELAAQDLRRLQMIELELLVEVDRICRLHGIEYRIIAGTMLGAARHGGFIPWDDDADVALFRSDYERFVAACRESLDDDRFYFQDIDETPGYRWGYGKLRRKRTVFLREHQEGMPYDQGVFIDIFPLDSIPSSLPGRMLCNLECYLTRKFLWSPVGKLASRAALPRFAFAQMSKVPLERVSAHLKGMVERGRGKMGPWVRILTFPTPANKAFGYKRRWYTTSEPAMFEGIEFCGVADPDDYLSFKFGNWRELPPASERKTHPVSELFLLDDDEYASVLDSLVARRSKCAPQDADGLMEDIAERGAAVFGDGFVARMFFAALQEHGLADRLRACAVSVAPSPARTFFGVPVQCVDEAAERVRKQRARWCIAVHEAVLPQVEERLEALGIVDAVWVYPMLHELLFGKPVEFGRDIALGDIVRAQDPSWRMLAVRACGVKAALCDDGTAASVYLKCMRQHCSSRTAQARLAALKLSVSKSTSAPVLVDEKLRIIDGLHRVAAARQRGEKSITCDVVVASDVFDRVFADEAKLTPSALACAGLTKEEAALLERVQSEIEG